MNKNITLFFALLFAILNGYAQPTNKFNYQAIARDASGSILANQNLGIKISIEDSAAGPVMYAESFTTATNQFGLFTLKIGGGNPLSGNFNTIDWSLGNQWLKVEMDPNGGNNYIVMGESELMSVPFANYAASSPSAPNINFRVCRNTTWSYVANTIAKTILWDSVSFIHNCNFEGDSAFIAPSKGLYHFDIGFTGAATGYTQTIYLFVNSTLVNLKNSLNGLGSVYTMVVTDDLFLEAGDKVYWKYHDGGNFSISNITKNQFAGFKAN